MSVEEDRLAAAIVRSSPAAPMGALRGFVDDVQVRRSQNGRGPIATVLSVSVRVDGNIWASVAWSGAFAAEVVAAQSNLVGREVLIQVTGGQTIVAYTINRS